MDFQILIQKMLLAQYSLSTVQKVKCVLNQVFNCAVKNKLIDINVVSGLKIPQSNKKVRALTREEQKRVVEASKTCALGHIIRFLIETGLRRDELINLKWEDYSREEKCIVVRKSKTPSGIRIIPLTVLAVNIIEVQPHAGEYIFLSTRSKKITNTVMKRLYERIRRKTGISDFTTHMCRHTFATRLIENGADAKSVSRLLGHTDVSFTLNRYTTIDDEQLRKTVERLEI